MQNILFIGSSGAGKSSIINAFFDEDIAPVGCDDTSCTPDVTTYTFENVNFYDTCGFFETSDQTINTTQSLNNTFQNIISKTQNIFFDKIILVIDVSQAKFYDNYKILLIYLKTFLGKSFTNNVVLCLNKVGYINHRNKHVDFDINEKMPSLYHYLNTEWDKIYPKDFIQVATGMTNSTIFKEQIIQKNQEKQLCLHDLYENVLIKQIKNTISPVLMDSLTKQQALNTNLKWLNIKKLCATDTRTITIMYLMFIMLLFYIGLDGFIGAVILCFVGVYHYKHFDTSTLDKDIDIVTNCINKLETQIYYAEIDKCIIKTISKPKNKNTLTYNIYLQFSVDSDMIKILSYDHENGFF